MPRKSILTFLSAFTSIIIKSNLQSAILNFCSSAFCFLLFFVSYPLLFSSSALLNFSFSQLLSFCSSSSESLSVFFTIFPPGFDRKSSESRKAENIVKFFDTSKNASKNHKDKRCQDFSKKAVSKFFTKLSILRADDFRACILLKKIFRLKSL
jgi:hypothetical protein